MNNFNWYHIAINKLGRFINGQRDNYTYLPNVICIDELKIFGKDSMKLDGKSDYMSIPNLNDFCFDTGDFTIDFWVRFIWTIKHWTHAQKWSLAQNIRRI
jgi:hypothetical protein